MDMSDAPYYPGGGPNPDSPEWDNEYFVKRLSSTKLLIAKDARVKAKINTDVLDKYILKFKSTQN
jgi:hypothetical protein